MESSMSSSPVKPRRNYTNNPSTSAAASSPPNFSRRPQPPLFIPAGQVAFRLLCLASRVGGLIGKSGCIIKQLQQLTNSKIHVDEIPNSATDHRIVSVIGSPLVYKRINLFAAKEGIDAEEKGNDAGGEWVEVSAAQEGMLRVFERVVEVAAERDSEAAMRGVVSCRLLAGKNQAGAVIGKGGMVVEKIKKDTGCRIKILVSEKVSSGSFPNEEIVEIEGDVLAVKKALIAVTGRLQEFPPPHEKTRVYGNKTDPLPLPTIDPTSQHNLVPQPMTPNSTSNNTWGNGTPFLNSRDASKPEFTITQQQKMVFRILCPNERVGGIIGKGGSIIHSIQNESGAHINIGPVVSECNERLITISAIENLESQYSPVQNAVVCVFNRCVELCAEEESDSSTNGSPVLARVVIPLNQIGCLIGKGGSIISEMRKMTGTGLRLLRGNQVPKCASENVEVLQITGGILNVQDALRKITSKLQENVFSQQMPNANRNRSTSLRFENNSYNRARGPSHALGLPQSLDNLNEHNSLTQSMDYLGISNNIDRQPPRGSGINQGNFMDDYRRMPSRKAGGLEILGSGSRSAIVKNTSFEIIVPDNAIGSVYGENGSNLARLRKISGAKVIVHEPQPGTTDRMVVISGSPDETQAAQSLLQAFLLAGSSS